MVKHWLLTATAAAMLAGPAFGHAKLRATVPSADAQLQTPPTSLTLSFNEDVRLAVLTLTAGGTQIPVTVDRTAPATPQVTVALPVLAAAKYQVQWSVLSTRDGHVSKGTFSFTIMDPATKPATPAAKPR
jgi:methionine-rich copper-binding protein CopC